MHRLGIKNDRAAELLDNGENLREQGEAEAAIRSIRERVHSHLKPEYRGKAPSKEESEAELEMP